MKAKAWRRKKWYARWPSTWPKALRITRLLSLSENQFLGCAAAFVDSLSGEMNAAVLALRRLEGGAKGSAFAHEMALDTHRYGALIVLDRWATLVHAFGAHVQLARGQTMIEQAPARVQAAENLLGRVNQLLDAAERYGGELVEACVLAYQSVEMTFAEERAAAEQNVRLGPMLPEEYKEARQMFLEDLAAR
jgi:hypothetical protein